MEIIIQPTPEAASLVAAQVIARLVREKPTAVLGLATGGTQFLVYRELARLHRIGDVDFRRVTTFNLDEYVGLHPEHPQSYHTFMWQNFFKDVNVAGRNVHIPDGMAADIPAFCRRYEAQIRDAGGIDLQLLGIGRTGHIGFNEPASSLASRTRIKTLTTQTRRDNARFFNNGTPVPHHAITLGIGTILEARQCLVLAFGTAKARAIAAAVEGPITAMSPASALQLHPEVKICLDLKAASRLKQAKHYRWVYAHKPEWQRCEGA